MLYCKPQHAFYDLAADIMAENSDLVATSLSKVRPRHLYPLQRSLLALSIACQASILCMLWHHTCMHSNVLLHADIEISAGQILF